MPLVALITGGHLDVPIAMPRACGRNQEFVLLWARELGEGLIASKRVVVAAVDSDGTDGPGVQHHGVRGMADGEIVCMAGGVADGYSMELAAARGVDVNAELANHNSTVALAKLSSAIYTGNTGMALGDLRVAAVR